MHTYKCSSLPVKYPYRLKHLPFVPAATGNISAPLSLQHALLPSLSSSYCWGGEMPYAFRSWLSHVAFCCLFFLQYFDSFLFAIGFCFLDCSWFSHHYLLGCSVGCFSFFSRLSLFCFPLFVALLRLHLLLFLLLSLSPLSVFLSLPVTVVSTLQYKVSTPPIHPDTPPEYRHYRASTLPPSYVRVASSSPPTSASMSPSQEKEAGAARDKAQLSSQLSTSLASAFSPVQAGVTTQGRQVRQIPLSPPTAARHLHLQQQQQQQDTMLPPKHGTWSASHLQQMYAQFPQSSSPPVMMAMPVKQGLPPQPVLPVAHPLPPVSTRMKPPPFDPNTVTTPHQYPQHHPHPHSNGQPDDSYSPHSQHLPLTPQYCEAIPLPPLTSQTPPGPPPSHQPQYPSTFHPQQQQQQQHQQQQVYHQQAQPPTTTTTSSSSSSSPPSYTAMSDGGSPKKTPSPVPQPTPMTSSSKYEEESGGGSPSAEGHVYIVCVNSVCVCVCVE